MPLEAHRTVKELAESALLSSPAETASCELSKGTASTPHPKGCGVFSYKGLDCLIVPSGKRLAVIILNRGNPFELEWTWEGKTRKDFASFGDARYNLKMFYHHALKRKWLIWDEAGRVSLKPRAAVVS